MKMTSLFSHHRSILALSKLTVLATAISLGLSAPARGDVSRVLPDGQVPQDRRLNEQKDLNGYFPFSVPDSPEAWEKRAAELRRRVQVATGTWPLPERTPLNSVIHGRIEQDGFTIEKVYFESVPNHFVTGLLFRPAGKGDGNAGRPAVLCPHGHGGRLQDYGAAKMFLKDADVTLIPEQGTAVAEAIRTAMRGFGSDDRKYKALILITDGENHVNDPIAVAEEAAEAGIRVFAVGVGTSEGELIPIRNGDRVDYLKDTEGKIVKTRLDEATLKEIARVTDGLYVRASGGGIGLQAVYAQIAEMEKRDLGTQKYAQYIHRFQWPLALALMCFAGEALLSDRRKGVEEWRGRFEA